VGLVEHVGGIEARQLLDLGFDQLVEDQEQLEGLDRSGVEVVVAVLAVVEVEARELAELDQPGHDHLDVDVLRVVPEVHERAGPLSELARAVVADSQSFSTGAEGGSEFGAR
jgi:hypothetical protein